MLDGRTPNPKSSVLLSANYVTTLAELRGEPD